VKIIRISTTATNLFNMYSIKLRYFATKSYAFFHLQTSLPYVVPPVDFGLFKFLRGLFFFYIYIYFRPSSDVNFLALYFLINPTTSAQTHVSMYMDLCECVQKTARLGAGALYRLRGRARCSYIFTHITTLRAIHFR